MFREMKAINQDNKDAQYQEDKYWYLQGKKYAELKLSLEDSVKDITNERIKDNVMRGWQSENIRCS
jgi:hypothetical protein